VGALVIDADGDYASALAARKFDYLFAITFLRILPARVLAMPARAFAGLIATTAFSGLMYLLVERHLGVLRRRLHGQKVHAPAAVGDAPVSSGDIGATQPAS